ncbi:MAG TPA: FUSC family protein [Conexibacter sp.]
MSLRTTSARRDLEVRLRRGRANVRRAALPVVQATIAAGASWLVATEIFGHTGAFFAPVSAIAALGASYVERRRRTVELMVGVTLGVAVGDLLVAAIGTGWWQLMLVVALAMTSAIFFGGGAVLITQAAVSAILIATVQPPTTGDLISLPPRMIDAFTGGIIGILVSVALPVDPLALARSTVRPLLKELADTLEAVASSLQQRDAVTCEAALTHARTLDATAGSFHTAVMAADETARMAPPRWGTRARLAAYLEADPELENAARNIRVLARGALRALQLDDDVPPDIPLALRDLASAVRGFDTALADERQAAEPRAAALRAAARATLVLERTGNLSVSVLVGQIRSTAVDLLRALGLEGEQALAAVRAAARDVAAEELAEALTV